MAKKRAREIPPRSKNKQQWRYWVVGIVVLAGAIAVGVWYGATQWSPQSGQATPLSEALNYSVPTGVSIGNNQGNNATVTLASPSLTIGSIAFIVEDPSFTQIQAPPGAAVSIITQSGTGVASFNLVSHNWGKASPSIRLVLGDRISLYWPGGPFLGGYGLITIGSNGFSGYVSMYLQ